MPFQILLSAIALLWAGNLLQASEEESFPWSAVRIAGEHKETGKVVFTAKLAEDKYQEITIEAFGQQFSVSEEDRERLARFPLNSLSITNEAGHEQTGGHMVHFHLKASTYNQAGNIVESRITITVSRDKGLAVSDLRQRIIKVGKPTSP